MLSKNEHPTPVGGLGTGADAKLALAAARNGKVAATVNRVGELMLGIRQHDALRDLLSQQGVTPGAWEIGGQLQVRARQACEECHGALARLAAAKAAVRPQLQCAQSHYRQFQHALAQACESGEVTIGRGLSAHLRRGFVIETAASYLAAMNTIPSELLAKHGFGLHRLHQALLQLQHLASCQTDLAACGRRVAGSTRGRDIAVRQLNLWMERLLHATRFALGPATPPTDSKSQRRPRSVRRRPTSALPPPFSAVQPDRFSPPFPGPQFRP
ncbi:MAG TPA: hypothetical protein VNR00_07925 [Opitutus sp.]|nr:hypothetical protein [Opitutus sp.]